MFILDNKRAAIWIRRDDGLAHAGLPHSTRLVAGLAAAPPPPSVIPGLVPGIHPATIRMPANLVSSIAALHVRP